MNRFIKKLLLFFIYFLLLIILLEILSRSYYLLKTCNNNHCNYKLLYKLNVQNFLFISYIQKDKDLGYTPIPLFNDIIYLPRWNYSKLTVDINGFRSNDNFSIEFSKNKNSILAVGDSFVFGDQVSNNQTWPSCLEREIKGIVINAGVSGYGSAQSLLRAKIILKESNIKIDSIILSILVGEDLDRDKYYQRGIFPSPAVIKFDGKIIQVMGKERKNTNKYFVSLIEFSRYSIFLQLYLRYDKALLYKILNEATLVAPFHASNEEIFSFIIDEINYLDVKNKYILLQYPFDLDRSFLQKERDYILKYSKLHNINIIDTYDVLQKFSDDDKKKIWDQHHTPYGNEIVCNQIRDYLKY